MNPLVMTLVIVLTGVFYVTIRWLKKIKNRKVEKVKALFANVDIQLLDGSANFFGTKSKGMGQVRGNGALVLTPQELYYEMWMPEKTLRIPRERISKVATAKSFLGKSKGRTLLVIEHFNDANALDASAWLVRDLNAWIDAFD